MILQKTPAARITSNSTQRAFEAIAPLLWRVPGLSERVAARAFLTPFGRLRSSERVPPRARGERVTLGTARPITAQAYGAGRPVFVVHGWGGSALQMSAFVDALVERGYRAVTFDLPAHGESRERQTNVVECAEVLLALARHFGAPAGVIAHSFGAAVAVLAQQRGLGAGALTFVAPLPSLEYGVHQFAARAHLPVAVMDRAARLIEADLGIERRAIELCSVGSELHTPLLCVHDQDDTTVAIEASRRVVDSWPDARLLETAGLGHSRLLRDPTVVRSAVAFLEQGHRERPSDLERALSCDC